VSCPTNAASEHATKRSPSPFEGRPIHPSAWKGNSANFAFTEFHEVHLAPVRCSEGIRTCRPALPLMPALPAIGAKLSVENYGRRPEPPRDQDDYEDD
jgi:hypothetical protein